MVSSCSECLCCTYLLPSFTHSVLWCFCLLHFIILCPVSIVVSVCVTLTHYHLYPFSVVFLSPLSVVVFLSVTLYYFVPHLHCGECLCYAYKLPSLPILCCVPHFLLWCFCLVHFIILCPISIVVCVRVTLTCYHLYPFSVVSPIFCCGISVCYTLFFCAPSPLWWVSVLRLQVTIFIHSLLCPPFSVVVFLSVTLYSFVPHLLCGVCVCYTYLLPSFPILCCSENHCFTLIILHPITVVVSLSSSSSSWAPSLVWIRISVSLHDAFFVQFLLWWASLFPSYLITL